MKSPHHTETARRAFVVVDPVEEIHEILDLVQRLGLQGFPLGVADSGT